MDDSPLRKLSPELRNRIAEFTLTNDICHIRSTTVEGKSHLPGLVFTSGDDEVQHAARLLQTCKQIRREYTQLFYASNSFILHSDIDGQEAAEDTLSFVKAIGPHNVAIIRSLTIDLGRWRRQCNNTDDLVAMYEDFTSVIGRVEKQTELRSMLSKCKVMSLSKTFDVRFGNTQDAKPGVVEVPLDYFDVVGSLETECKNIFRDTGNQSAATNEQYLRRFLSVVMSYVATDRKWRVQRSGTGHGEK